AIVHERQKREVEDTVGTQLLNIARTGALLVDPALHAEVQRTLAKDSRAYTRLRKALAAVQAEVLLPTPIRTLSNYDPVKRRARLLVTSDGSGRPGEPYPLAAELLEPLGWTFEDGVARYTRIYRAPSSALTRGVARVAAGDLSQELPVRSRDEVGQLTRAFNEMVAGLRQRDFIRNAFGRYVSPEVAKTLLESPEGLRLGGHKRVVTVLMSDLRGYTRFAEQGDPAWVMEVLNDYLARMADIVIAHGGTINEFIGDAIFAVFGAPLDHGDHAERAAAAALAMQAAMVEPNRVNAARGWPRFEMGIGVNTGEAVVGNIGSEQRAKYAVVGAAVNLAARVEGCTVGGQIFVTAATLDRIRALADVAEPV